jgi:hypothetical protein
MEESNKGEGEGGGRGIAFSESVLADRLMSVSEEILMFLFRQERVKHLKIGDVRGG